MVFDADKLTRQARAKLFQFIQNLIRGLYGKIGFLKNLYSTSDYIIQKTNDEKLFGFTRILFGEGNGFCPRFSKRVIRCVK